MDNLEESIERIRKQIEELEVDLNKADRFSSAAQRARKATSNLEKEFKNFRKISIEHHRK